jgi:hypothetical protein
MPYRTKFIARCLQVVTFLAVEVFGSVGPFRDGFRSTMPRL